MSVRTTEDKTISAVIACYNDSQAIPEMHKRLISTFIKIGINYEIIFVNDGSLDNSEDVLKEILKRDSDNIDALSSLADFYNQKGSQKEAIDMIESAIEKEPDSLIANVIRLKLSSYKGNLNEVRKDCDSLINLFMKEVYQHSNSHLVRDEIEWLDKNSPDGTSVKA